MQKIRAKLEIFIKFIDRMEEKRIRFPLIIKMGDQEQQNPGRASRMSTCGMPNEGGSGNRGDGQKENPMSISGKW